MAVVDRRLVNLLLSNIRLPAKYFAAMFPLLDSTTGLASFEGRKTLVQRILTFYDFVKCESN